MSYRDDIAALEARVESLRDEAIAKLDEFEQAQQLAADARRLVRSRVLEAELATPCTVRWEEMEGDAQVRHCGHCRKNVYNFGELTRDEIDALVVKHEGSLCARLFVRSDGTLLAKDCTGNIRLRPRRWTLAVGAAAIAAGAAVATGGPNAVQTATTITDTARESGLSSIDDEVQRRIDLETARESSFLGGVGVSVSVDWNELLMLRR